MTFRETYRALLTETLPYEVPVIFSNEQLYASCVSNKTSAQARQILDKVREKRDRFTIPYQYQIRKDEKRATILSIVHPNYQIGISAFYDINQKSILSYCDRSKFSLRRPVGVVDVFSANKVSKGRTLKLGIPHIDAADGETEAGHVTSYFSYGRFNLLGRFMDSREFRGLEMRFPTLRSIDISKCFAHIYTHSVTWASKGKAFAKENVDVYSFEGAFDRLMQGANYNETNGIVIGPEISRIFAEVILQDVDRALVSELDRKGIRVDVDYSVRRYVDDYFVFARTLDVADEVQNVLADRLEHYKLFLNSSKTETFTRPFVSKITLAKGEVADLVTSLHSTLNDLVNLDLTAATRKAKEIAKQCTTIRLICKRHGIALSSVSGWFASQLRVLFRRSLKILKAAQTEQLRDVIEDIASSLLDAAFYVCALDLRVRSTYSLCQLLASVQNIKGTQFSSRLDRLLHQSEVGLEQLFSMADTSGDRDSVELDNLLIAGTHFLGAHFLNAPPVASYIDRLLSKDRLTYFQFITLKFCLLKDSTANALRLRRLNFVVAQYIDAEISNIGRDSELYLTTCDYISSPDITANEKRPILQKLIGALQPSNAAINEVSKHIGFADWGGLRIQHLLARKELRPVYAWS